jgi:hypothetical protein
MRSPVASTGTAAAASVAAACPRRCRRCTTSSKSRDLPTRAARYHPASRRLKSRVNIIGIEGWYPKRRCNEFLDSRPPRQDTLAFQFDLWSAHAQWQKTDL